MTGTTTSSPLRSIRRAGRPSTVSSVEAPNLQKPLDGVGRQAEHAVLRLDQQKRLPGGRERHVQQNLGSPRIAGPQESRTVELACRLRHHGQAHATAREAVDLARGRKARREDERQKLIQGRRQSFLGSLTEKAAFDGDLLDSGEIGATTIVANADRETTAPGSQLQDDFRPLGLSFGQPLLRGFDAVADGVAQKVHDRVLERLKHLAVDLDIEADGANMHIPAIRARDFPHHMAEAAENGLGRDEGNPVDVVANLPGRLVDGPGRLLTVAGVRKVCERGFSDPDRSRLRARSHCLPAWHARCRPSLRGND